MEKIFGGVITGVTDTNTSCCGDALRYCVFASALAVLGSAAQVT